MTDWIKTAMCCATICGLSMAQPVDLILIAGDLNATTHGQVDDLSQQLEELVTIQESVLYRGATSGVQDAQTWKPAGAISGQFGVEMGMAYTLAERHPDHAFGIMRYAHPTSTMMCDWHPDPCGESHLASMLAQVEHWRDELKGPSRVIGMVWVHGELDAQDQDAAFHYQESLFEFAQAVRNAFEHPSLPLILTIPHAQGMWAHSIEEAMENVAKEDPHLSLVTLMSEPKKSDALHLSSAGLIAVGTQAADALLSHDPFALATPVVWCPDDVVVDGEINMDDLLYLIGTWGPCTDCRLDFDLNGHVDIDDLLWVLGQWGDPSGDVTGDGIAGVDDMLAVIGAWGPCQGGN